ncbi:unnamed protein product [Ranitomeya imitator]|uniref:Uncharacterized protein n=1 Tax=Ranitomeya imitator TaxID=111125 RepID=A0ABN9MIQ0_9NEOB|nr:unnamed protein product [Ranitomeya imitator]
MMDSHKPSSKDELLKSLRQKQCERLVESMPRRMKAVIKNHGRSSVALAELLAAKCFNPFRRIYIIGLYRSSEDRGSSGTLVFQECENCVLGEDSHLPGTSLRPSERLATPPEAKKIHLQQRI